MKLKEVLSALERFAPLPLQESWDNAGLQIGLTEAEVSGALLCLDVSEEIVDEAIQRGFNLVVSHHPLLFHGLKKISDSTEVERVVRKAVKNDVAIISMHTNLDNAKGGVNWRISERLGLDNVSFFAPKTVGEMVGGSGVIGQLPRPISSEAFISHVKRMMEAPVAQCNQLLQRPICKVAICGGAGDFLLEQALALGADAFITGEMHYHVYQGHDQQVQVVVIGHYESEHFTAHLLRDILNEALPALPTAVATTMQSPVVYL